MPPIEQRQLSTNYSIAVDGRDRAFQMGALLVAADHVHWIGIVLCIPKGGAAEGKDEVNQSCLCPERP